MKAIRWSDEDKYWWIFTYCHNKYRFFDLVLGSGCEEYPRCRLRISIWKHTLIIALPNIIKPSKVWVDTTKYNWENNSTGGYYDINPREYGISCHEGFINFKYGRQTNDSRTEQRKGYFIPWKQWRHVRTSYYSPNWKHYYTEPKEISFLDSNNQLIIDNCPSSKFKFKDYDGEELTAVCVIREMEHKLGSGYFKFLSFFNSPKISKALEIKFSGETGREKGSWKGGTIGASININQDEAPAEGFKRYCTKNEMIFMEQI